jgi:hypothetical protein
MAGAPMMPALATATRAARITYWKKEIYVNVMSADIAYLSVFISISPALLIIVAS